MEKVTKFLYNLKTSKKLKMTKLMVLAILAVTGLLGVLTSTVLVLAQDMIINETKTGLPIVEINQDLSLDLIKQELGIFELTLKDDTEIVEIEYVDPFKLKDIGVYSLTAYCPCSKCCGKYAAPPLNKTGSIGTGVYENVTVAVDPAKIPYGTKLYIEGVGVRIASDCGGAIKGNKIDVYYTDHNEALASGLGHTERQVYIIED